DAFKIYIENVTTFVNAIAHGTHTQKWLAASALCYAHGKYRHALGDFDGSLLSNHRSLDLFLQALCLEGGLLVLPAGGEFLYVGEDRDTPVGVRASMSVLRKYGELIFSERSRIHLEKINELRNKAVLTHSLMSLDATLCSELLAETYSF